MTGRITCYEVEWLVLYPSVSDQEAAFAFQLRCKALQILSCPLIYYPF